MSERLKIYIAGPYTAPTEDKIKSNVLRAIDAGLEIYRRGHFPYIPHLTHFVDLRSKELDAGMRWEDYIHWDRAWLTDCDALLHLASSRGADLELGWAKEAEKRIFYNVHEIPVISKPRDETDITLAPTTALER